MRILMHTRPDWRELPGGDFVQLQRWTLWLRALGIHVDLSDEARPNLAGIDLVHFNNLGRAYVLGETLQHCQQAGVPTVLTPLYWPGHEFERHGRPGWMGLCSGLLPPSWRDRLKSAARWLRQPGQRRALLQEVWAGSATSIRRFLAGFHALLPNSHAEAGELSRLLPEPLSLHVVPSGVDAHYWSDSAELWGFERQALLPKGALAPPAQGLPPLCRESAHEPPPRRGVLCVARFDPQKAQHRLIRALRPLDVELTLAGPDNPNYPGFRAYCHKLGGGRLTILPQQGPDQLRVLYRSCHVHALCSWYETTGLTGLEAGCCGARVVMTDRGGTHDYGGDRAWYADPADLYSIGRTIERALQAAETPDLRGRVRQHFTWEQSARNLLSAYRNVLEGRVPLARAA